MKYVLTDETIEHEGKILFRIQATRDIVDDHGNILVHAGEKGGFVENTKNLSQEGTCWIYDDAKVFQNAKILDDAQVRDKAQVYYLATIKEKAIVRDNAEVCGKATVGNTSVVQEFAQVYGLATIDGDSEIGGYCQIHENAHIHSSHVYGNANIFGRFKAARCNIRGYATLFDDGQAVRCRIYDDGKIYGHTYVQNRDVTRDVSKEDKTKTNPNGEGK